MNILAHHYRKIAYLLFLTIIFFAAFLQSAPSFSNAPVGAPLDWLTVTPQNQNHYELRYNTSQVLIDSKRLDDSNKFRLFIIISKESPSYVLALNTMLEMLNIHAISISATIQNFNRNSKLGNMLLSDAKNSDYDLIVSMGSEAAALVHESLSNAEVPVVTMNNKDPVLLGQAESYEKGTQSNIAMTSLNVPIQLQMFYLKELIPNLKNIAILHNPKHQQVQVTEVIPTIEYMKKTSINVYDIPILTSISPTSQLEEKIPQAVQQMQKTDPSLSGSVFWLTSSTVVFKEQTLINELIGNIPLIGNNPNTVNEDIKHSAVLAIGIDRGNSAKIASNFIVKILSKRSSPSQLPIGIVKPPDLSINLHVAKRIGLKIPFTFLEKASFIYGYDGEPLNLENKAASSYRSTKIASGNSGQ